MKMNKLVVTVILIMSLIVLLIGCKQEVEPNSISKTDEDVSMVEIEDGDCVFDAVGSWQGVLDVSGTKLRLNFDISEDADGNLVGDLDSLDQGALDIKADSITTYGYELTINMDAIGGKYTGEYNVDSASIIGTWKQGGNEFSLNLEQNLFEPDKQSEYYEEEVMFDNAEAGITLAGTLTFPSEKGVFPVVILISGSGPQDRDETLFGHKPFKVIAEHLAENNIAVLRYDDRGYNKSTGDFESATSDDFATDVEAAIDFLMTHEQIDVKNIGLIGHSEGGLIAPMVANESDDVAFVVMLAGPGVTGYEIIMSQMELLLEVSGFDEDMIKQQLNLEEVLLKLALTSTDMDSLKEKVEIAYEEAFKDKSDSEKEALGYTEYSVDIAVAQLSSPWMMRFLAYDPAPALENLSQPLLAINGSKDLQVEVELNLSAIEEALIKGGHDNYKILRLEGLNHLLQTAQTGLPSEYGTIEETISPIALESISEWILKQVK